MTTLGGATSQRLWGHWLPLIHGLFALFVTIGLSTPSWRVGPFAWWPLWQPSLLAGRPADVGLLTLLPVALIGLWLVERWRRPQPWQWGASLVALPLGGLSLLVLLSLDPAPSWRTMTQVGGIGLAWLCYLFLLNERPALGWSLATVLTIQGSVAILQFATQGSLGLTWLGELSLDPHQFGTSVLLSDGHPWLRAYGLTAHPNLLGATLTLCLLLLLPMLAESRGLRRLALLGALSLGLLGVLVSFSRTAWLALVVGAAVHWFQPQAKAAPRALPVYLALPLLVAPGFLWFYRDMVLSRFLHLNSPIEALSLSERLRDVRCALHLVEGSPWTGTGAGNYLAAALRDCGEAAAVHNVSLLAATELGIPGLVLWAWLVFAGLRPGAQALPVWTAFLLLGLFDNTVWLTASWRGAMLLGLIAAHIATPAGEHLAGEG